MIPSPTIGRIVHLNVSGQRVPAVVTYVHSATCINVNRLDGGGAESSVVFEAEGEETKLNAMDTQHRTWAWPPRS